MEKKKTFSEIANMWFEYFAKMKPEQRLEIAVSGKRDPALFVDMCKSFIDQGNIDFEFTNDYKYFRRISSWPA